VTSGLFGQTQLPQYIQNQQLQPQQQPVEFFEIDSSSINQVLRSWINSKYLSAASQNKGALSDSNPDRRKKTQYLDQGDRDLITQVEKRLANQEKLNRETQAASRELKTQVELTKKTLAEANRDLLIHS
jgi:hypothetical protein